MLQVGLWAWEAGFLVLSGKSVSFPGLEVSFHGLGWGIGDWYEDSMSLSAACCGPAAEASPVKRRSATAGVWDDKNMMRFDGIDNLNVSSKNRKRGRTGYISEAKHHNLIYASKPLRLAKNGKVPQPYVGGGGVLV